MSKVAKFRLFWFWYLVAACGIVYAALAYTAHLAEEADHTEEVEFLTWEVNSARTEAEEGAKENKALTEEMKEAKENAEQDGLIIRSVLLAVMASAENNIADMEAGSLLDCIDATCRVTTISNGNSRDKGTGVVFEIRDGKVRVITNAHVATTPTMYLEFWKDGHKAGKIIGTVTLRDRKRDVAVISVDVSAFDGWLPGVVPLAARDTVLKAGQKIMSAGCPRGEWTKAWVGHVVSGGGSVIKFLPKPVGGQSGSAIFNAGGTHIVALLNQYEVGLGRAVSIRKIHDAIYGEPEAEETRWRQAPRSQCPDGRCPDADSEVEPPLPDLPFVLPVPEIVIEIVPEVVIVPDTEDSPFEVPPLPDDYVLEGVSPHEVVWRDGDGSEVPVLVDLADAPDEPLPVADVVEAEPDEDYSGSIYNRVLLGLVLGVVLIVLIYCTGKRRAN